jgi:hypothetical protein
MKGKKSMKLDIAVLEALKTEVGQFKEMHAIEADWLDNFPNCNAEIMNAITESDSGIRADLISHVYGDDVSADDWRRLANVDASQITWFGRIVSLIRFGVGFIGNGEQGDQLLDIDCLALNFSYRAYWTCGSNVLIRSTVGRYLGRSTRVKSWPSPVQKGSQRDNQIQQLASAICTEMQNLRAFYDLEQMCRAGFSDIAPTKPPLRDFRALLTQINDADAAEKTRRKNR